jgi:hypothetical protein
MLPWPARRGVTTPQPQIERKSPLLKKPASKIFSFVFLLGNSSEKLEDDRVEPRQTTQTDNL